MFSHLIDTLKRVAPIALALGLAVSLNGPNAAAVDAPIQPSDVLAVQVSGEPGLSQNYPVDERGDITMDMVGKIHVAGLEVDGARQNITDGLKKYLKLFSVEISVVGEAGGRALVFGEVLKPGPLKLRSDSRLLDVLADAGQPTIAADTQRISVIRKDQDKPEVFDLDAVLKDPALNVPIHAGDTVTVPGKTSHAVQVDGEVKLPGLRGLESYKTAYAAILSAEPGDNADWSRIVIHRRGSSIPMIVDLSSVHAGQLKDDLPLQEGDQVTVMSRFTGTATLRGEVKSPGEKPLNGRIQLWDFIVNSGGGFTDRADRADIEILRGSDPALRFNLLKVAEGQENSADPRMEIRPGDVIFIPNDDQNRFVIVGGVMRPGTYPVKADMTLLDAIADAGGFSQAATHKEFVVDLADRADGRLQTFGKPVSTQGAAAQHALVTVDYRKLIKGDPIQNLPIKSGDRILIPEDQILRQKPSFLDNALRVIPFVSLFAAPRVY